MDCITYALHSMLVPYDSGALEHLKSPEIMNLLADLIVLRLVLI